jgi:hypothetical protein
MGLFLSVVDGSEWSTSRPGRLTPGKEPLCLPYSRLIGPNSRYGRLWGKSIYLFRYSNAGPFILYAIPLPKSIRVTILVVSVRAVKTCGEMEVWLHLFLTLGVQTCEWSASCPIRLITSDSSHSTPWIWVSVDPKSCPHALEESCGSCSYRELNIGSFNYPTFRLITILTELCRLLIIRIIKG